MSQVVTPNALFLSNSGEGVIWAHTELFQLCPLLMAFPVWGPSLLTLPNPGVYPGPWLDVE